MGVALALFEEECQTFDQKRASKITCRSQFQFLVQDRRSEPVVLYNKDSLPFSKKEEFLIRN